MRCIICDKCGAVIENESLVREIVCMRPGTNYNSCMCDTASTSYRPASEIVWKHEVCIACADSILESIEANSGE